jgi:hypothetical protein
LLQSQEVDGSSYADSIFSEVGRTTYSIETSRIQDYSQCSLANARQPILITVQKVMARERARANLIADPRASK